MQVITIDGPAGAGKSTVARMLARRLGWRLLDTGAMYRAVALAAVRAAVSPADHAALGHLVDRINVVFGEGVTWLDGEDVSSLIRGTEITRLTGPVADCPQVRNHLVGWQRQFAVDHGPIVTEGRDQGTVVFPQAQLKIFLTASDDERASRRHAEMVARGDTVTRDAVLQDVRDRDARDRARTIAPLIAAPDAWVLDSTGLDLDEVVAQIAQRIPPLPDAPRQDPAHP